MKSFGEKSKSFVIPERKREASGIAFGSIIGGSSILVILAVLCLAVFALISIATVNADVRLADKQVDAIIDYYNADAVVEEVVAELRSGTVRENITRDGDTYSFAVMISETRVIEVIVRVNGSEFEFVSKHVVSDIDGYT